MASRRDGEHQESPWRPGAPGAEGDSGSSPSAIILFALVGATATTAAVSLLLPAPSLSLAPDSWMHSSSLGGGRS